MLDYPAMHWGQHKAIPGIDYVLSFVSMFDNPKFATIRSGVSVFLVMLPKMDRFSRPLGTVLLCEQSILLLSLLHALRLSHGRGRRPRSSDVWFWF